MKNNTSASYCLHSLFRIFFSFLAIFGPLFIDFLLHPTPITTRYFCRLKINLFDSFGFSLQLFLFMSLREVTVTKILTATSPSKSGFSLCRFFFIFLRCQLPHARAVRIHQHNTQIIYSCVLLSSVVTTMIEIESVPSLRFTVFRLVLPNIRAGVVQQITKCFVARGELLVTG